RLHGHSSAVWSVAFSPDGKQALTGSRDRTARLWSLATGKELRRLEGHSSAIHPAAVSSDFNGIHSLAFSPNGKQALTGGETAILWDLATGKELQLLTGRSNW